MSRADGRRALSPQQLTEAHLPLVRTIARRYAGRGEELEDLVQLGSVGLVKASKRFDPDRGVAFATFATPAIEGEIRHHLRDRASPLRIPRAQDHMNVAVRRSDRELAAMLGRSPTHTELAATLGIDETDVESALRVEQARYAVSISGGDAGLELAAESQALDGSEDRLLLARSIRALDDRERQIVFLRFHADMTERQIGSELGISQSHVSRLLAGALAKLRSDLARSGDITPVISPTNDPSARKIPAVGGISNSLTLAEYLELPYRVEVRGEQDRPGDGWQATVEELPGCVARGATPDEAVARLRPAMEAWLSAALEEQREIPKPGGEASRSRSARGHSGRFLVRMPKALHGQLALAAEREHVSLNRFVTEALAASLANSEADSGSAARSAAESGAGPTGQAGSDRAPAVDYTPATSGSRPPSAFRLALATNLAVVVITGLVAVALLVIALQHA